MLVVLGALSLFLARALLLAGASVVWIGASMGSRGIPEEPAARAKIGTYCLVLVVFGVVLLLAGIGVAAYGAT